jgi:hypothetical protein
MLVEKGKLMSDYMEYCRYWRIYLSRKGHRRFFLKGQQGAYVNTLEGVDARS